MIVITQDGGDTDSDEESARLADLDARLREHDEGFAAEEEEGEDGGAARDDSPRWHQIHLDTERIRVPEILFQVKRQRSGRQFRQLL